MAVVPAKKIDKVSFFENHNTPWSTNATALGTTTAAVTDLATKTLAARNAFNAQQSAMDTAKAATETFNAAVDAMATAGAAIISQIRAKAKTSGDSVYALAQIPSPATPKPAGAPGQPTDFKATLDGNGSLVLTWKCSNTASGVIYQIYRALTGSVDFAYLGGSGERKFTDNTIPAGTTMITYQIQGVRSTGAGPWAQFNVNFGVGGAGMQIEETSPSRKAA